MAAVDLPFQCHLDEIITKSSYDPARDGTPSQFIVTQFNRDLRADHFVVNGIVRGRRIEPGTFRVFQRNNIPFIVAASDNKIAAVIVLSPSETSGEVETFDQNVEHEETLGVHILNVRAGHLALATRGTRPVIYGQGPHVIHDSTFRFGTIVPRGQAHIAHNTFHILNIPIGKLATVTVDNTPVLLEGRGEPYTFANDPTFNLVRASADQPFYDTSIKFIFWGPIKRMLPGPNEVVVTNDAGVLKILRPVGDGKPIMIQSINHVAVKKPFLSTNRRTDPFPKNSHVKALTMDGVEVKMKLLITYEIANPELAVKSLTEDGDNPEESINTYIEELAKTDMSRIAQTNNYYASQFTEHNTAAASSSSSSSAHEDASAPIGFANMQDEIRHKLATELREVGINLHRLTFEEFSPIDDKIIQNMANNARMAQDTHATVSNLENKAIVSRETARQDADVRSIKANADLQRAKLEGETALVTAEAEAKREAEKKRIAVMQENEARLKKAEAELKAAELRAKAIEIEARAEAAKIRAIAEARAEEQRMMMSSAAACLQQSPELLSLEIAKLQAHALAGIKSAIITPESARNLLTICPSNTAGFTFNQLLEGSPHQQAIEGSQLPRVSSAVPSS